MKEETLRRVEQFIRKTFSEGRTCDDDEIAEALNLDVWDVTEATTFLEEEGRIKPA